MFLRHALRGLLYTNSAAFEFNFARQGVVISFFSSKATTTRNTHESPSRLRRWEEKETKKDDGTKWKFLQHKGPMFAADYEPLPKNVKFFYNGREMKLTQDTEEVATFYGRMLDHDYTQKTVFNTNFFKVNEMELFFKTKKERLF